MSLIPSIGLITASAYQPTTQLQSKIINTKLEETLNRTCDFYLSATQKFSHTPLFKNFEINNSEEVGHSNDPQSYLQAAATKALHRFNRATQNTEFRNKLMAEFKEKPEMAVNSMDRFIELFQDVLDDKDNDEVLMSLAAEMLSEAISIRNDLQASIACEKH